MNSLYHDVLQLRREGHSILEIHELTGESITRICEVIWEQNRKDIDIDGADSEDVSMV